VVVLPTEVTSSVIASISTSPEKLVDDETCDA